MIDQELNKKLKMIWAIDDKIKNNHVLLEGELQFYFDNLHVIKNYYKTQYEYWKGKKDG